MTINITQEDRDAAARWAKMQSRHQQAANMRRGACDTAPLIQAFARHRIAAEAKERERIVAWLRDQETKGFDRMVNADTETGRRNYAAGAVAVQRAADLIEAGEHTEANNATGG